MHHIKPTTKSTSVPSVDKTREASSSLLSVEPQAPKAQAPSLPAKVPDAPALRTNSTGKIATLERYGYILLISVVISGKN